MATLDVVIPVLNEEQALPLCIDKLRAFLKQSLPEYKAWITVADNGSTDRTLAICEEYSKLHPNEVRYIHLDVRGRGRALRRAWLESDCDILTYMDVDLSTDLQAFPPLVNAIGKQGYDIATGSRLMRGSKITRSTKREITSRGYNAIIKLMFFTRFSDAQCGFKAISREAAHAIIPHIVNNHWFFDTELLIIGEKRGFRIKDIPVRWIEDPGTTVKLAKTINEDLKGLARLRFGGIPKVAPPVKKHLRSAA